MRLSSLDLSIVIGYVALSVIAGLYLARRATRNIDEYFVGGRSLPWWLAGTSMIASAFSIDTPFGITGLVAKNGVQGVWFAWAYAIGGAGTFGAFIFASLLRRSNIITAAELVELRYSGPGAAFLRGFKGLYFGVLSLAMTMGWVLRSVVSVSQEALGWDMSTTLVALLVLTIVYTTASGFWGVAVTDFFQFFLGAVGSLILAYCAVRSVGGLDGLQLGLEARYGAAEAARRLHFVPRSDDPFFFTFLVFTTLKWWGNPPISVTQRLMATKDERHATFSMMFFAAVHFAINYWPMILVALVSLVRFPELSVLQAEQGYAKLLVSILPPGLLGIVLASLAAAFMSTIDTQANAGASFLINDLYRRFLVRDASTQHYVRASQVGTILMLGAGLWFFFVMESVRQAWEYLATMTAGYGFITVARWFWWRINAWTELAALAGSALGSFLVNQVWGIEGFGVRFAMVVMISTASWFTTACLTSPPDMERLVTFCRLVKPYPLGWGPVRAIAPDIEWSPNFGRNLLLWGTGLFGTFCLCFAIGHALLGSSAWAATLAIGAALSIMTIVRGFRA